MRPAVLCVLLAAACATDPVDPCVRAAEHVAVCTGETSAAAAGAACDAERADAVLAMDCEELAAAAAAGKADGWWDDFLCLIGFSSHCAPSDDPVRPTARTLTGNVHKTSTGEAAPGVYVRLAREGSTERRGAWTVAGGLFAIEGLAPARYQLEVALAPGSGALATQTVDVAAQSYVYVLAPVF